MKESKTQKKFGMMIVSVLGTTTNKIILNINNPKTKNELLEILELQQLKSAEPQKYISAFETILRLPDSDDKIFTPDCLSKTIRINSVGDKKSYIRIYRNSIKKSLRIK